MKLSDNIEEDGKEDELEEAFIRVAVLVLLKFSLSVEFGMPRRGLVRVKKRSIAFLDDKINGYGWSDG